MHLITRISTLSSVFWIQLLFGRCGGLTTWEWPESTSLSIRVETPTDVGCSRKHRCNDACGGGTVASASTRDTLLHACYADALCLAIEFNTKTFSGNKCYCSGEDTPPPIQHDWDYCPRLWEVNEIGFNETTVVASKVYTTIVIDTSDTPLNADHVAPTVKLVRGDTSRGDCSSTSVDIPGGIVDRKAPPESDVMGALGIENGPISLTVGGDTVSKPFVNIVFMHGGAYRLCYTPEGDFSTDSNSLVDTVIKVIGIKSPCRTDGCIETERWDCSFAYKGESITADGGSGTCMFNFNPVGGRTGWDVESGEKSSITWSAAWAVDQVMEDGQLQSSPEFCGSSIPDTANLDTTSVFLPVDRTTLARMPRVSESRTEAFTLTACYCPNYDAASGTRCTDGHRDHCCDDSVDFIQQFGIMYFWTMKICDHVNYLSCDQPYMRVLPQQKFVLRVECPPGGGCEANTMNRIKYIETDVANNVPAWDVGHGCRHANMSSSVVWQDGVDGPSLHGGDRTDYKVWREVQARVHLSLNRRLDVCFCNSGCNDPSGWVQIGFIETSRSFALSFKQSDADVPSHRSIQYAGHAGSVNFLGGIQSSGMTATPYDSNPFSGRALLKVLSYDREAVYDKMSLDRYHGFDVAAADDFSSQMDVICQGGQYLPSLFKPSKELTGPGSKLDAKEYIAAPGSDDEQISSYLSFSGLYGSRNMVFDRAGVMALCYCAIVSPSDECRDSSYWLHAGLLTVQGPMGGQKWIFPTGIVIKLAVRGWGLTDRDRLRVVPASGECSSSRNSRGTDDNTGPAGVTLFNLGCESQTESSCLSAHRHHEIEVQSVNTLSTGVSITAVESTSKQTTLIFSHSIQNVLEPGDVITLDVDHILIDGKDVSEMSENEKFDAHKLSGELHFQDDNSKSFMVGHRLSVVEAGGRRDHTRMTIPIGWTDGPTFSFVNASGHWMRRNLVQTDAHIKGMVSASNLKVCWGVQEDGSTRFFAEAGRVTFHDPPAMKSARVVLTSTRRNLVMPVVLSFQTSPLFREYSRGTSGKTLLMLRFLDTERLVPVLSGGDGEAETDAAFPGTCLSQPKTRFGSGAGGAYSCNFKSSVAPLGTDDAKQTPCTQLFTKFWSSSAEGFPSPERCSYSKRFRDAASKRFFQEVYIVFGEGILFRQNAEHQIVINAHVGELAANSHVVDMYAMCGDEVGCARPYMVFEKGSALVQDAVAIDAVPLLAEIWAGQPVEQSVVFRMQAPRIFPNVVPSDQDIIVVLDVSTSMNADEKLTLAKAFVTAVIGDLGMYDRIHLVTFHGRARLEFTEGKTQDRDRLISQTESLASVSVTEFVPKGGGFSTEQSNLIAGLEAIIPVVRSVSGRQSVKRLLVVSDGHVNRDVVDERNVILERIEDFQQDGMVTSTIAVGVDYDRAFMALLAECGRGDFRYIQSRADLPAVLGDLVSLTATAAELRLLPLSGGFALQAHARRQRTMAGSGQQVDVIRHGTIRSGAVQTLLVDMLLPGMFSGTTFLGFEFTYMLHGASGKGGVRAIQFGEVPVRVAAAQSSRIGFVAAHHPCVALAKRLHQLRLRTEKDRQIVYQQSQQQELDSIVSEARQAERRDCGSVDLGIEAEALELRRRLWNF